MSGWGCPHELRGRCKRVKMKAVTGEDADADGNTMPKCDPGMQGCILHGRFRFSAAEKNKPAKRRPAAGEE